MWKYLDIPGHGVFFTRRGKRIGALMSIETHACLSGDCDAIMAAVNSAVEAYRKERQRIGQKKLNCDYAINNFVAFSSNRLVNMI